MMSNLNSNMTSQFPLAIPTRSKGPQARLVLRGDNGIAIKQWLIKQSKCTLGSDPDCAVRCDLPGIAAYHVLIVVGLRQTFLRSLAPKLTRDGVTVNELLLSGDSNSFEIAGHQFELTRQDSSGQLPPADGTNTRMRFAASRPLETKSPTVQSSSPTVIAQGEHSDLLPAGADTATPRWVSRIVRDAILPLENQLREVMQPIENLQTEVRREKRRRLAEEQRRERLQEEKPEKPQIDAAAVEAEVKQQVSAITARQSSSLDVITERISDVNQQLTSIERLVAAEQDTPPPPMDPQITAEIEAQSSSVQKLQEGFVAVAGALSALQDSQRETAENDAQWKADIQGKLEALQGAVENMHTRPLPEVEQLSDEQLNQYAEQLETCQSNFAVVAPDANEFSHQDLATQSVAEEWDISTLLESEPIAQAENGPPPAPIAEMRELLDFSTVESNIDLEAAPTGTHEPEDTPEVSITAEPLELPGEESELSAEPQSTAEDFDHDWDHSIEIVSVEEVDSELDEAIAQSDAVDANNDEDDEFPIIPQALGGLAIPSTEETPTEQPFGAFESQALAAATQFSDEARSPWEDNHAQHNDTQAPQVSETSESQTEVEASDGFQDAVAAETEFHQEPQGVMGPELARSDDSADEEVGEAAALPSWWDERASDTSTSGGRTPSETTDDGFTEQEFAAASPWDLDAAAWPDTKDQPELGAQENATEDNLPNTADSLALGSQTSEVEPEYEAVQDSAADDENLFSEFAQDSLVSQTGAQGSNDSAFELLDNLDAAIDNDAAADNGQANVSDLLAGMAPETADEERSQEEAAEPAADDQLETIVAPPETDYESDSGESQDDSFPTMNLMSEAFGTGPDDASQDPSTGDDDEQVALLEPTQAESRDEASRESPDTAYDIEEVPPASELLPVAEDHAEATDFNATASLETEEPFTEQAPTDAGIAPPEANNAVELPSEVTSGNGESEDDSVEDYMKRLLARMRGEELPEDEQPKTGGNPELAISAPSQMIQEVEQKSTAKTVETSGKKQTTAPDAVPANSGLDSQTSKHAEDDGLTQAQRDMLEQKEEESRVLRRQQSQNPGQLAAMRELANSTARTAIVKSNQRRVLSSLLLKSGIALVGLVVGIALIAINGFDLNIGLIATIAALLVAAIWGWDAFTSLNHFRQAPATAHKSEAIETAPSNEAADTPDAKADAKPVTETEL